MRAEKKLIEVLFFVIRSVPIFKNLPEDTLIKISDVLEEVSCYVSVYLKP